MAPFEAWPAAVALTEAREHGGVDAAELQRLGLAPERVLDFSVNVNPYGPHPAVVEAIRKAELSVYPHPTARPARVVLGRMLDVDPAGIMVGNGATELLWTLAGWSVGSWRSALVVEPTFSEFATAVTALGGRLHTWHAASEQDFRPDLAAVAAAARRQHAGSLYLCTPNNPTGVSVPAADIAALGEALPDTVLVVDESFLALSERHADTDYPLPANVVRVRSLTKTHALPGLRVGYLLTTPRLVQRLEAQRPVWSTGTFVQAAITAMAGLSGFVQHSRARVLSDRERLDTALAGLGLRPVPSTTCFTLVPVGGRTSRGGARLRSRLLRRHGILVRDCASFGLPAYIRLAARPAEETERLAAAMGQEL